MNNDINMTQQEIMTTRKKLDDMKTMAIGNIRLAIMSRTFSLSLIGMFVSSFFLAVGSAGISVDSLPGFVAGSAFILVGATATFFTLRMFLHLRDLMNSGETVLRVIKKVYFERGSRND